MADALSPIKSAAQSLLPPSSPVVAPKEIRTNTEPITPTQAASQVSAPAADEAATLQHLMQGTTGKGAGTSLSGPQQGTAQVQAVAAGAMTQRKTLLSAIQAQQELTEQEQVSVFQQMHEQDLQLKEQAADVRSKMQQRITELLAEFQQQGADLNLEKQRAKTEQASFLIRMQNDKYIAKLRDEGKRAGLVNKAKFQSAALDTAFEEQAELMTKSLQFKSLTRANARDFTAKLANMDVNTAWEILMSEISTSATQTKYNALASGVTTVAKGIFDAAKSTPPSAGTADTQLSKDVAGSAVPTVAPERIA